VFAGGCTLAAAEAVCAGGDIDEAEVVDLLAVLASKSLLYLQETGDREARYQLLETVRQYARERLAEAGETAQVGDQHLAWCLALAEQAEPALVGPEQHAWLARLEQEHDNLRAALSWAGERGAGELGLRLAGALFPFWSTWGYASEGRGWLDTLLVPARHDVTSAAVLAKALKVAGNLACEQSDYGRAAALLQESLAIMREFGEKEGMASTLDNLGIVAMLQGDYEQATILHEEGLALQRERGNIYGIACALNNLGLVAQYQGHYQRAPALYEESLAMFREVGDKKDLALTLGNLGLVAYCRSDYGRAAALYEEALSLARDIGNKGGIAHILINLGTVARYLADYGRAAGLYEESLALYRDLGDTIGVAEALEGLAAVAGAQGRPEWAARLFGAAEALREPTGASLPPWDCADYGRAIAFVRSALAEDACVAAWAAGHAMPLEEAIALALEGRTEVVQGQ
jgi:tetratricopeptide (TPR) repeat protein